MLNKKAIAAFAAGATLLSGFAFAAPAMAMRKDNPCKDLTTAACTVKVEEAQKAYDNALKAVNDKKDGAQAKFDKAVTDYNAAVAKHAKSTEALNAAKAAKAALKQDATQDQKNYADAQITIATQNEAADAQAENAAKTAKDDAEAKLNAAKATLNDAKAKLDQWKVDFKDFTGPTKDETQQAAIDNVRAAKMTLDNADNAFAKAKKAYYDAKAKFLKAQAELNARTAAYNAATTALENFRASGVNDSAKETRLQDAVNRANAHLVRATAAYNDAQAEYDKTYADALAAKAVYEAALQAYKDAYDYAVSVGVNPALLPPVVTADPLDVSFNPVPGSAENYHKAVSGEFGPAVQAAAKSKASAQKNNKNNAADANGASASAAAQLPKSGAAVAMAAVAASVLAGMGAALRKIRH